MRPILLELGPLKLPGYGFGLALAVLISIFLLGREAKRMGLNEKHITDTAFVGLLFGLIGSKLLLILIDLPYYLNNPREILGTIRAAGVLYGGQIGGILGALWYMHRKKLPIWQTLDVAAPFFALAIGLGRLSCLMAGCCYGYVYDGPLALHFPAHPLCEAPPDIGLFPVQPLAMLNGVVLFLILLFFLRRRTFYGQIMLLFIMLYGISRGLLEMLRGDGVRGLWFGETISTSQIIALLAVVSALAVYLIKRKEAQHAGDH